ncbi:hypothetical protein BGX23_000735 [Mortierella sp. AD031]|nr:hypothetical protein BGX23_000735 [Mortierella sp. AD031]KAG0198591.1 hypothetical protein BGX33_012248 [Mortierella sp. NVP41]
MSFNLGNSDRMPAIGGTNANSKNPLQQAINSSNNNRGAGMVLTPDHPSWHADHNNPASSQNSQNAQGNTGGVYHDPTPGAPYTGGRANTSNTGPLRAGPDHDSYLPPGAAPQGARFDPIIPDAVGQSLPNRSGQHGQNPPGFASGEPDYDELLPPK